MFDEFRLRGLDVGYVTVAQVQLGELPLHVLELHLGVPVQCHRDAFMGQNRLKKLWIQAQSLSHGGERLSESVRVNALGQARGLLDPLARPPRVLPVRFLSCSSGGILSVSE